MHWLPLPQWLIDRNTRLFISNLVAHDGCNAACAMYGTWRILLEVAEQPIAAFMADQP